MSSESSVDCYNSLNNSLKTYKECYKECYNRLAETFIHYSKKNKKRIRKIYRNGEN